MFYVRYDERYPRGLTSTCTIYDHHRISWGFDAQILQSLLDEIMVDLVTSCAFQSRNHVCQSIFFSRDMCDLICLELFQLLFD